MCVLIKRHSKYLWWVICVSGLYKKCLLISVAYKNINVYIYSACNIFLPLPPQVFRGMAKLMQQCWLEKGEARLTTLRLKKNLANLQNSKGEKSKKEEKSWTLLSSVQFVCHISLWCVCVPPPGTISCTYLCIPFVICVVLHWSHEIIWTKSIFVSFVVTLHGYGVTQ